VVVELDEEDLNEGITTGIRLIVYLEIIYYVLKYKNILSIIHSIHIVHCDLNSSCWDHSLFYQK
jgi:hypothetical protein